MTTWPQSPSLFADLLLLAWYFVPLILEALNPVSIGEQMIDIGPDRHHSDLHRSDRYSTQKNSILSTEDIASRKYRGRRYNSL